MDYKEILTRYKELKLETQAVKNSLNPKIVAITVALCTQRNRVREKVSSILARWLRFGETGVWFEST